MNQIKQGTNGKLERRTKKNKFLKTAAVAVMASFMGLLTILSGCAPTQTNTNLEENGLVAGGSSSGVVQSAPSPLGLDPENDPVIYTTENGLEIKFGGINVDASLASGALTGYPYFTMGTYSGYPVNWVIIGRNPNDAILYNAINSFLFSAWKSGNQFSIASVQSKAYYFFNNIFETNSPAGAAINAVTPSKSYVADISANTKPVANNEVPKGTVLALSEYCLGTSIWETGHTWWHTSTLYEVMDSLYTSGLGLTTTEKNMIQKTSLTTRYWNVNLSEGTAAPATFVSGTNYLWALAYNQYSENLQNFYVETYLKTNALRVAYNYRTTTPIAWWMRTMGCNNAATTYYAFYASDTGSVGHSIRTETYGVRPACIVKFT